LRTASPGGSGVRLARRSSAARGYLSGSAEPADAQTQGHRAAEEGNGIGQLLTDPIFLDQSISLIGEAVQIGSSDNLQMGSELHTPFVGKIHDDGVIHIGYQFDGNALVRDVIWYARSTISWSESE
jgi:hypothetical protein